jgi:hypothetical protein
MPKATWDEARRRILAATDDVVDIDRLPEQLQYVALLRDDDPTSIMLTEYVPTDGVWYVTKMWGSRASWLPMIKEAVREIVRRGHGAALIRCTKDLPVAIADEVQHLNLRPVTVPNGEKLQEIQVDELLSLLTQVRV